MAGQASADSTSLLSLAPSVFTNAWSLIFVDSHRISSSRKNTIASYPSALACRVITASPVSRSRYSPLRTAPLKNVVVNALTRLSRSGVPGCATAARS